MQEKYNNDNAIYSSIIFLIKHDFIDNRIYHRCFEEREFGKTGNMIIVFNNMRHEKRKKTILQINILTTYKLSEISRVSYYMKIVSVTSDRIFNQNITSFISIFIYNTIYFSVLSIFFFM